MADLLDLLMFLALCAFLLAGFPVAPTLAGTALLFAALGTALGVFDFSYVALLPHRLFGIMTNEVLIAVPLFIFMGVMLERSRVAEELLDTMARLMGGRPGGLGVAVTIVGALLAASTGIVGATVVTMGLLSLPTMLRRGYSPALAAGSIAAAGTLGQIIPPSIVLVLLGDVIASAHQEAQRALGNFSFRVVSVGDLFAGALLPGLLLVGLYIAYQVVIAALRPETSPGDAGDPDERAAELWGRAIRALLPALTLIAAVLGSILAGIATPTEAAAVGAVGATLLAALRFQSLDLEEAAMHGRPHALRLGPWPPLLAGAALVALLVVSQAVDLRIGQAALTSAEMTGLTAAVGLSVLLALMLALSLWRVYRTGCLIDVMRQTTRITAMVFLVLMSAALFSLVFRGLGGDDMVRTLLSGLPGGAMGALAAVMAVMFVMGFFLDFIEIIFIVVPIVAPVLLQMGLDPVWLGVLMAINLQTSFLTPPFGFALFFLRGVAPPELRTLDIYRGVIPFIAIQILALLIVASEPRIATLLPRLIFGD